jgi:hypothetical protein
MVGEGKGVVRKMAKILGEVKDASATKTSPLPTLSLHGKNRVGLRYVLFICKRDL